MFKNKTVMKIFSLLASILLWFYVMGEVDPETKEKIREIPVTYTNTEVLEENGLAALQEEELFISTTIKGKRSYVNRAKKEGLTASVDVAACEEGRNTCKISVNLPEGVSVDSISQQNLRVKVEPIAETEKPVRVELEDAISSGDKAAWVQDVIPQTLSVKGAESAVAKVAELKGVVPADKAIEEKSKWVDVELLPVTKEGERVFGIVAEAHEAEVRIQVLQMKTVAIELSAENPEKGMVPAEINAPQRVRLAGPASIMENLEHVQGTIDLKGITEKGSLQIVLELPEDVLLVNDGEPLIAEVIMKKNQ